MTARGGTHLPTEIYDTPSSRGPTYLQKFTTSRRRGDPPTYRNVERWHRNLPTLGKERNPGHENSHSGEHIKEKMLVAGRASLKRY